MILTSPESKINLAPVKIFLGGTIDMGNSEDWQKELATFIQNRYSDRVCIFNPRRKQWDISWKQDISNPHFFQQVSWELDAIEKSDIIIMVFLKDSKSPISFFELGLVLNSNKHVLVLCEKGFYREGNIQIICERYNIPLLTNNYYLKEKILELLAKRPIPKLENRNIF